MTSIPEDPQHGESETSPSSPTPGSSHQARNPVDDDPKSSGFLNEGDGPLKESEP